MKCLACPLKYIGQTGRTVSIRYKEHIQAIRNNNSNLGYSNYILNTGHTYGTITDTVGVVRTGRKTRYLEKYCIYKISRNNLHMNDIYINTYNRIFQMLHELYHR
jgi:Zn-dependent peptidase ImmA (M78 family)